MYTLPSDVRGVYEGELPAEADSRLNRLIEKAEQRLLARVPSIPARVESGDLDVALVRGAVEDIVLRVVRNPNGYSSEQAGAFAYRLDRAVSSGQIEVHDGDLVGLLPPRSPRVGTIRLGLPAWRVP